MLAGVLLPLQGWSQSGR